MYNPIYVTITTVENDSKAMHMTHDKERHDKHVKEIQDDIDTGATYKTVETHEIESIDCQNLWLGVLPEYSDS